MAIKFRIPRGPAKLIFDGLEGSGKSLLMTVDLLKTLDRNIALVARGLPMRSIYVNTPLNAWVYEKAKAGGVEIINYDNFFRLEGLTGCDIYVDEIGAKLNARRWETLSITFVEWLSQCDKQGVRIIGTAQDFSMVDLSFRRLTTHLYRVRKVLGSPRPHPTYEPINKPWGLFSKMKVKASNYKESEAKIEGNILDLILGLFWLKKIHISAFNTNAKVKKTGYAPLEHIERSCLDCGHKKVIHI